jgi:hypothetical protein
MHMHYSRRQIMSLVPGSLLLGHQANGAQRRRPRIAALTTIYFKYSHSQHIVDRFLEGYGWQGKHHQPEFDVVSLYVEQTGENDLSRERVQRYPQMKLYPTIADALTQGGSKLDVDGVLLIGEHGDYPTNEKGQKLYPRYEYFQQVVDVFRRSGRTAPVFSDKHLSWNWDWAKEMVETSRELGFGFMAGSSLPVSRRLPSRELPPNSVVSEAVAVAGGGIDGGDIHIIEAMQSILERRRGGETGIRSVEALRGDRFWRGLEAGTWQGGGWDRELMQSALSRCDTINPVRSGYGVVFPKIDDMRRLAPESYAYRFEYADGLKATVVQFQGKRGQKNAGVVGDRTIAARLQGGDIFSLLFYLPYYSMRNFFNPQVHHIESLFRTNRSPYPVERTLLTTGMTAAGIESLFQNQKRLETPHLAVHYQPTRESTFWRS